MRAAPCRRTAPCCIAPCRALGAAAAALGRPPTEDIPGGRAKTARQDGAPALTLHLTRYPGCIANTDLFREKRDWFRFFFFPTLMKAIGSYVSQAEG